MPKLVAIVGSVTAPGRLLGAVSTMLEAARQREKNLEIKLINLADYRIAFADGRPPEQYGDDTAAVVKSISESDAVIVASPLYRASITGALKNLLDQLPVEALLGKPVGIVAMGATTHHYLGADWHLRDILAWFGAFTLPNSVYLSSADFVEGKPSDNARADLTALAIAAVKLAALDRSELQGPKPLAVAATSRPSKRG